jgi:PleD family two-component response regulator
VQNSRILKLLIVEDSPEDEQLLSEALLEIEENRLWSNWRSANIIPVDRLSDALDCLRRERFDAILLNLSLPDSRALLDSFLEVVPLARGAPILALADEPDESLATRLIREGAQDVLVKVELECVPLARAIRYAIERQRRTESARESAFTDPLTGVLSREAFRNAAALRKGDEVFALVEIATDREALDPLMIRAAEMLREKLEPRAIIGRWDRSRFCLLAPNAAIRRAEAELSNETLQFYRSNPDELGNGELPLLAKTAILAD